MGLDDFRKERERIEKLKAELDKEEPPNSVDSWRDAEPKGDEKVGNEWESTTTAEIVNPQNTDAVTLPRGEKIERDCLSIKMRGSRKKVVRSTVYVPLAEWA